MVMKTPTISLPTLLALTLIAAPLQAAPFGNEEDLKYAGDLWDTMEKNRLIGEKATISTPYKGVFPHGDFLDTLHGYLMVGDHDGRLIIKRNYGGKGAGKETVANKPAMYLKAITVMYQREKGYDKPNKDWFWVKYNPAGQVMKNPKGIPLAGRVAKGNKKEGCIACHTGAPGNDMVFNNDRF
jgi:hypothetical protein